MTRAAPRWRPRLTAGDVTPSAHVGGRVRRGDQLVIVATTSGVLARAASLLGALVLLGGIRG